MTAAKTERLSKPAIGAKLLVLAVAAAFTLGGASAAVGGTDRDDRGRERGGFVMPCSLVGVNPVHHPEIFANPATARSMGFVQTADGVWHVVPDCRR
jgi:hypothetical protein